MGLNYSEKKKTADAVLFKTYKEYYHWICHANVGSFWEKTRGKKSICVFGWQGPFQVFIIDWGSSCS